MSIPILTSIVPAITSLLYLVLLLIVAIRHPIHNQGAWKWLITCLGVCLAWSVTYTLIFLELLPGSWIEWVSQIGLLLVTSLLLRLTRSALKDTRRFYFWNLGAIAWFGLYIGLALSKTQVLHDIAAGVFVVGWVIFMTAIAEAILRVRRSDSPPSLKVRTYYWSIGMIILAIGGVLFFADHYAIGVSLIAVGMLIINITLLRPYMPDIRLMEQSVLNYLVMTILTALVLILGSMAIASFLTSASLPISPMLIGAIIAFILAALLAPLWFISHKIAQRLLPQIQFNPERILREYSQPVSNILDPEKLSAVSARLINEGMEIQHGFLFLVEQESEDGSTRYRLRSSKGSNLEAQEVGLISYDNPIAEYFRHGNHPLHQADIDLQPRFQSCNISERTWLHSLNVDIYIPVYAKDEWIGLFALGPKMNGQPYFDNDLAILNILADQTGVALQNARLVESLMRVNNDFRRAYSAMEQSNRHLKKVNVQLEGLDKTKSEFINVASHELQTPLNEILGYMVRLLDDPGTQSNPAGSRLVDSIYSNVMRMNEIVNSMLDIASIDMQTMELRHEHVSISAVIQTIQKILAEALKERGLTLEASNLSDLPPVDGDSQALHKVFYQVILNAIKYTPDGGKISITGVPVSAGQLGLTKGGVEIIISDTGIGISRDNLELIFSKFYQTGKAGLYTSEKTKFKSTGPGLGLAIAKGIVEAHRGQIWAESPGLNEETCPGSTFHIVLPLHYKSQPLKTE